MATSIYLILVGITFINARPSSDEASFFIRNEHDLQRLLKALSSQGKYDIAFSHHEDGPKTHHEDRARFIHREENHHHNMYHGNDKHTSNRHTTKLDRETIPGLTNIQNLNLFLKKKNGEIGQVDSSNDDNDIEKLLGLGKKNLGRNGNNNAVEVLELLKDLGDVLDNGDKIEACTGDKCGRDDDRDDRNNLRCSGDRCDGDDRACTGDRCGRDRDDDDDDDDDDDRNSLRCNGDRCGRDNRDDNTLRCFGDNCGRADCVGDRCGYDRDDDEDDDTEKKTLRCSGDNCGRLDDDRACVGDNCGRFQVNDNLNVLRCSGDSCGANLIDRTALRERTHNKPSKKRSLTKKFKINDDLDAIVVDMTQLGKPRSAKSRSKVPDNRKKIKLIQNVDLDNLIEDTKGSDIFKVQDIEDFDNEPVSAVIVDLSKAKNDLSSEISDLVAKLQEPLNQPSHNIGRFHKKQQPQAKGRSHSKILAHLENNNNVYVPQWLLDEVISQIPKKEFDELADAIIDDLPLTPKQKAKVKKALEKVIPLKKNFRRSSEEDVGVPFHLEISGLGQANP